MHLAATDQLQLDFRTWKVTQKPETLNDSHAFIARHLEPKPPPARHDLKSSSSQKKTASSYSLYCRTATYGQSYNLHYRCSSGYSNQVLRQIIKRLRFIATHLLREKPIVRVSVQTRHDDQHKLAVEMKTVYEITAEVARVSVLIALELATLIWNFVKVTEAANARKVNICIAGREISSISISEMRNRIMLKSKIWPLAMLVLSQNVFAVEPPTAGTQLQQIPPSPTLQQSPPEISLVPSTPEVIPETDSVKINVQRIQLTGMRAYSETDLVMQTAFKPNSELTLPELRVMAAKIADYYHKNGYFVAQAYLPAQEIKNGVVSIAVIEGQYGKIIVRNPTNLSNRLVNSQLEGINSGDVITSVPLENRLLLLSDIAGVNINSTLAPGADVGTSDLIVDVTPGARVNGSIEADNAGNRYTGKNRIGATIHVNNLAGQGDVVSLRVLTSGEGLNYAKAAYQIQLAKATVGVGYSWLEYELGEEFTSLDAHGDAKIASVYGSYPLIRSRNTNLYTDILYENKVLQDEIGALGLVTDKKVNALTAALRGEYLDKWAGGSFSYSVAATVGDLNIQTPAARAIDALTARSDGHYTKLTFNASRLQRVTDSVSLYAGLNAQLASKNLDNSEKMQLGGMYAVRAYPEGEAYADEGFVLTLEARQNLPKFSEEMSGQLQLVGFIDTGRVNIDQTPWSTGDNTRSLSGVGVGINWSDYNNFLVKLAYAQKLGSEQATSAPDSNGQFWVQLVKYF